MRVGRKSNVEEVKRTRSCVVRLEKVSKNTSNIVLPSPEEIRYTTPRTNRFTTTTMGPTVKGRRGGGISTQLEDKVVSATAKKKVLGGSSITHSSFHTTQQQQQRGSNSNMSNVRSNQKVKIIPRSNKTTPSSTPSRDESPPPTIAAGRSRRAIKPNPKYASEDMVTPKAVRNVGMPASSSRGGQGSRTRKTSSSSDDFYNHDSEDEYDNDVNDGDNDDFNDEDMHNDKAYQESEKDEQDSDFSVVEEPVRILKSRGRPKRPQDTPQATTQQINNKLPTQQQPANIKRMSATFSANTSNLRSAPPSQLQQIRRSLASATAQRNINLLTGSGGSGGAMAQKRKLEEFQDLSDDDVSYTVKRKQILLSNSSDLKAKLPVRENKIIGDSIPIIRNRLTTQPQPQKIYQAQQTVNGSNKFSNIQTTSSRRAIEISAKSNSETKSLRQSATVTNINQIKKIQNQNPNSNQAKLSAAKQHRLRSNSPKPPVQKEKQNNGASISISSASSSSSASLNTNNKANDKTKMQISPTAMKSKSAISHNSNATISSTANQIKDDSPNSTIDDFETMPTFTIVNVNDIINKKGDVLITEAKSTNNNKMPRVIEFSESICLDDDDDDDNDINDNVEEVEVVNHPAPVRPKQILSKKLPKLPVLNNRKELENKKSTLSRQNESKNQAPQILNHKLGLRNSRVTAKTTTTLTATLSTPDKPAPRILNSMVAKKTQPVKPMIANMDDSADESFPMSLDEDEDEEAEQETEDEVESRNTKPATLVTDKARKSNQYQNSIGVDTEDTESQNTDEDDTMFQMTNNAANRSATKVAAAALTPKKNATPQRKRRTPGTSNTPFIVSSNKQRLTPAAAKENSLAAINQQANDITTATTKQPISSVLPPSRTSNEKVVISKQGDKIIKKITCFETWYVINMPVETKRQTIIKNQLEMPLIRLANHVKNICLPNDMWNSKVTLYELSPQTLVKGTFVTYTGNLYEHNISEEDRGKYQPSCVMFRRSIEKKQMSRMPYDRAVIFKNKTFYTNIEGKNVRLMGAPSIINSETEIEILLEVVDTLTLQSDFVEHISIVQ